MTTEQLFTLIGRVRDRASALMQSELKARGLDGLVASHGELLSQLLQADGQSMQALAEAIGRDKSTVTALVKKLAAQALVETRKDLQDQRMTRVFLTASGRSLRPTFEAVNHSLLARMYQGLSWEERQRLVDTLNKVLHNL